MIGELITDLEAFAASLRRGRAVNVNDQASKEGAIGLATRYFRDVRPHIVSAVGESDRILQHDQFWQQLVRLAHGNNARRSYLNTVEALRKQLSELNIRAVIAPTTQATTSRMWPSREENLILQTLQSLVPSAATSYQQGMMDLTGPERFSYRGTAAELREALRETLDHLAPDADVEQQLWYKPEKDQTKPTMKQKARYVSEHRRLRRRHSELIALRRLLSAC
jgi:hypothetical protein